MNRTNRNPRHYTNNHCTESAVEFTPNLIESQCIYDTSDLGQSDYDSLDEWVESCIDTAMVDDNYDDVGHVSLGQATAWFIGFFEKESLI